MVSTRRLRMCLARRMMGALPMVVDLALGRDQEMDLARLVAATVAPVLDRALDRALVMEAALALALAPVLVTAALALDLDLDQAPTTAPAPAQEVVLALALAPAAAAPPHHLPPARANAARSLSAAGFSLATRSFRRLAKSVRLSLVPAVIVARLLTLLGLGLGLGLGLALALALEVDLEMAPAAARRAVATVLDRVLALAQAQALDPATAHPHHLTPHPPRLLPARLAVEMVFLLAALVLVLAPTQALVPARATVWAWHLEATAPVTVPTLAWTLAHSHTATPQHRSFCFPARADLLARLPRMPTVRLRSRMQTAQLRLRMLMAL